MIRENRYLVLKWSDIRKYCTQKDISDLNRLTMSIYTGRVQDNKNPEPEYVCIKEDWPEYETVWKMLEERVDNESAIYS